MTTSNNALHRSFPTSVMSALNLTNPRPLAQTPRAELWRVTCHDGREAVLKALTAEGISSDEARAGEILAQWDGRGAAHIYDRFKTASGDISFVIEWLEGPRLGDMARGGDDADATDILAQVAGQLSRPAVAGFPDLRSNGADLERLDITQIPEPQRANFALAKACWFELLDSTQEKRLLHADLHHDNILKGARGWSAIDPRGLNGDPAYEFANAFRNPIGMKGKTADPDRIQHMADVFAQHSGLERARILQFAFAHCALSLSWSLKHGAAPKGDLRILEILARLTQ